MLFIKGAFISVRRAREYTPAAGSSVVARWLPSPLLAEETRSLLLARLSRRAASAMALTRRLRHRYGFSKSARLCAILMRDS